MISLDFSVPYNNDLETLNEVLDLKERSGSKVVEVYLSSPQEYAGSARITPETDLDEFEEVVHKIKDAGLKVNLLLNSTCGGSYWYSEGTIESKLGYLEDMHERHGLDAVTVANPIYIEKINDRLPDLEICTSVLGEVDSLQRARLFERAGADVITPDVNINRDLDKLKRISSEIDAKLKLMVNEGCLYKCPNRKFHFNYISHKSRELGKTEDDPFFGDCFNVIKNDLSQLLKSCWIRPEDLREYTEITDLFKIVGRARPKSMVLRTLKAYMDGEWDKNLLDIMSSSLYNFSLETGAYIDNTELEDFFEHIKSCEYKCEDCGYCSDLINKLIEFEVLTEEKKDDLDISSLNSRRGNV
ncbi:MAG: Collagenase family protease [Candidatus Methanohalarchaeum thermophilum]|uniref:Collagenase family protease n=1 Tax=Methanohalarchaeum thermophilum TaxID=1903181 RepID=A0A1Q6DUG0_METT1|nr:MAG: Collagenase family protease [Candidatus Methanohalarchaeum thermophilum]